MVMKDWYSHPENMTVMLLIVMVPVVAIIFPLTNTQSQVPIRGRSRTFPVTCRYTCGVGMGPLDNRKFCHYSSTESSFGTGDASSCYSTDV